MGDGDRATRRTAPVRSQRFNTTHAHARARACVRAAQYPVAELAGIVVLLGEVEDHVMIAVMALEEFGDLRKSGHGKNTRS